MVTKSGCERAIAGLQSWLRSPAHLGGLVIDGAADVRHDPDAVRLLEVLLDHAVSSRVVVAHACTIANHTLWSVVQRQTLTRSLVLCTLAYL